MRSTKIQPTNVILESTRTEREITLQIANGIDYVITLLTRFGLHEMPPGRGPAAGYVYCSGGMRVNAADRYKCIYPT